MPRLVRPSSEAYYCSPLRLVPYGCTGVARRRLADGDPMFERVKNPQSNENDIAQGEVEESRLQLAKLQWYTAESESRSCICEVRRRGERGIIVVAPRCPKPGELATLRDGQSVYRVVVEKTLDMTDGFIVNLSYVSAGRRREERMRTSGRASIAWDTGGHAFRAGCEAEVTDVSSDGLQLITTERIPDAAVVRVFGESLQCLGKVRYCVEKGAKYSVGLHFIRKPSDAYRG